MWWRTLLSKRENKVSVSNAHETNKRRINVIIEGGIRLWNCVGKQVACEGKLNGTREWISGQSILSLSRLIKNIRLIKCLRSERHSIDTIFRTGELSWGGCAILYLKSEWRKNKEQSYTLKPVKPKYNIEL